MKTRLVVLLTSLAVAACEGERNEPDELNKPDSGSQEGGAITNIQDGRGSAPAPEGQSDGAAATSQDGTTSMRAEDGGWPSARECLAKASSPANLEDVICAAGPRLNGCSFTADECREQNKMALDLGLINREAWLWLNGWTASTVGDLSHEPHECLGTVSGRIVYFCAFRVPVSTSQVAEPATKLTDR